MASVHRHAYEGFVSGGLGVHFLDTLWCDDLFEPASSSQVVPDVTEMDFVGISAGMQQQPHLTGRTHPDQAPWQVGTFLQHPVPSPHILSTPQDASISVPMLTQQQPSAPAPADHAAGCQHAVRTVSAGAPSAQQQQQPQWVPMPEQQQQEQEQEQQGGGFVWPCPDVLRCSSPNFSKLTAAHMVPLVFPTTPNTSPPSIATVPADHISSSCCSSEPADQQLPQPEPVRTRSSSWHSMAPPAGAAAAAAVSFSSDTGRSDNTPTHNNTAACAPPQLRSHRQAVAASTSCGAAAAAAAGKGRTGSVRSRAEAVARYRLKRARRSAVHRVRYHRRKEYAEQRPRVRGRFVKASELQQQQQSTA